MNIEVDDDLIKDALEMSKSTLTPQEFIHKIILAHIRVEAGRYLASLGGKAPNMRDVPR